MVYKWSDLVGQAVANLYVIKAVHAEEADRAAFIASTVDDEVPVLIEVLGPDSSGFENQRQCWNRAAALQHPNLVRILDTGETAIGDVRMLYCAKERHDDELAAVLDSRPLTEAETRDVLGAILPCLDHIHRQHCVHGSVSPSAVLAFGDHVKLSPDTIQRSGPASPASDDIHAIGMLVMEMLTGRHGTPPHLEQISMPLREVVQVCMDSKRRQSATPGMLMRMLNPPVEPPHPAAVLPRDTTPPPAPAPPRRVETRRRRTLPIAAAVVAATLLIAAILQRRRAPEPAPAPTVAARQEETRPSPVVAAEPARQDPQRARQQVPSSRTAQPGSWAVVAATYRNFEAAQKRAESLRRQWKQCDCTVYPQKGEARSYYYVLVGAGLTKNAAERLQSSARASRFPSDTYVTTLQNGGTRARGR
jgi:hypothetical protein